MKNQTQAIEQKQKKENQLVFIEYEKPTKEGHFMTIMDSYRNVIGRVNKSYNEQSKKFEYAAFDHAGKPFSNGEKLWEVKNEFINNREELLKEAHQRRIESKEKSKGASKEKSEKIELDKSDERKNQIDKLRHNKTGREKQNEKSQRVENNAREENNNRGFDEQDYDERHQELDDIRNDKDDDRGEMNLVR